MRKREEIIFDVDYIVIDYQKPHPEATVYFSCSGVKKELTYHLSIPNMASFQRELKTKIKSAIIHESLNKPQE